MALHPMLRLALLHLPEKDQDRLEELCSGEWDAVREEDGRLWVGDKGFVMLPEWDGESVDVVKVATCPRCGSPSHGVLACPKPLEKKGAKGGGTQRIRITDEARRTLTAAERKREKVVIDLVSEEQRHEGHEKPLLITVPGDGSDISDDLLERLGSGVVEKFRKGLPSAVGFDYHPDVLALYGLDENIVESCLRAPERVELRPESFNKDKRYVVLGFWKGDVNVILGLRDATHPRVIATYVTSRLEPDTHRPGTSGGGGSRRATGLPRTPRQVATRLRSMGAEVEYAPREKSAPVTYKGNDLGKISTDGDRKTCESDFQRVSRKMQAIDQRVPA